MLIDPLFFFFSRLAKSEWTAGRNVLADVPEWMNLEWHLPSQVTALRTDWRKGLMFLPRYPYTSTRTTYKIVQATHAKVFEYLKWRWATVTCERALVRTTS